MTTPENETFFYATARLRVFGGHLTQAQVDGLGLLLNAWDADYAQADPRWLAYALATATHETGFTMRPLEEQGRGAGHAYGRPDPFTKQTYFGRGYVQLTWKANYARLGEMLKFDLVNDPGLALEPAIASQILYTGMVEGAFTGAALAHFFDWQHDDPEAARAVINGTDCAGEIAHLYRGYVAALVPPQITDAVA